MTDITRPKLTLKLSAEALNKLKGKLQAKMPKIYVKPLTASDLFKSGRNPVNKVVAKKEAEAKAKVEKAKAKEAARVKSLKPKTELERFKEAPLNEHQYFNILTALQKGNRKTFPPKDKMPKPLAIGIHKEIAKVFKISTQKSYMFCRMYCGTKRYKEAVSVKGAIRRNLSGKNAGLVE
tara:strand:- start:176 stop:712 length:537 start_codon:yes stop_codon:yes gene_type:complete